jgi:nucleoside-diphosphate-sugar epimerase
MPRYVVIDFLNKLEQRSDHLEILGTGKQIRDLNYVSDTAAGIITLALRGEAGEPYNVGSGTSCSITELAHMLLQQLNLPDTTISYTGASWSGDVPRFEADITKLKGLGYTPEVSLGQGLKHVIDWFNQQKAAPVS